MKKLFFALLFIPSLAFANPPFQGVQDTETVSASTSSAAFTLGAQTPHVLLHVDADVEAFFKCGTSAQTATVASASFHMGKGSQIMVKPNNYTVCAVILASGTANVYATPGFAQP